uniref:CCDC144C-like coiled-coil domain-containing protein n=1 Tax=Chlorocebus sabaeus TaxID=60711 RepID=A0A0D9RFQ1_CHLSB
MKRLLAAARKGVPDPERPSALSKLVYAKNDSYIVHFGDLGKIHKAASLGQVRKLESMTVTKKTIDLNKRDVKKRTALHWACVNGHVEVVTFLVDRKCQLDILDGESRTPLMKALQCQREACANILIDSGADLNVVDIYGNTALHYAVYSENLSMVAKLLSHGAVIEVQNKASLTPFLLAIMKRSERIVEFLLTKNANANAVNEFKRTALMLAICDGSSEIVGMLLQQNVDIFAEDICGMTAEHYAATCGVNLIHQQLLKHKQKLSKNPQNTNPEGTPAGTTDEAAPLAERTLDMAESLVERPPDEAAPLAERTLDMAESLVERPPDEAAPLVEGTSDKIQCQGKATSGKFEQSSEETPRKIMRPTKETSEKSEWPAKERHRKITREEKETSVKTECVAEVTPNKTEDLEKGTSKMIACPTKETSIKASTNGFLFHCESHQDEFNETLMCDTFKLSKSKGKRVEICVVSVSHTNINTHTQISDPPASPSQVAGIKDYQTSVNNKSLNRNNLHYFNANPAQKFPSQSKQKDDEEDRLDFENFLENVLQNDECLPKATHQKEFSKISGKLEDQNNRSGNLGTLCSVLGGILRQVTGYKQERSFKKEPPEKPSAFKPATKMQNSVPNEAFEWKNEQTLRPAQKFPSESKQKDDEEDYLNFENFLENLLQNDVYLPKATHRKEFDTISGKLEESPHKDGLLKPTCGMKVSIPNKALELKDRETFKAGRPGKSYSFKVSIFVEKNIPNKKYTLKNKRTVREDELDSGKVKKKEQKKNLFWEGEIISVSDTQNYVCLTEATYQKEIKTIKGKIEVKTSFDQMFVSKHEDWYALTTKAQHILTFEILSAKSPEKSSDFEPATEMQNSVPNKGLEWKNKQTLRADNMFTLKSGQEAYAESHWSSKSVSESAAQNYTCLPEATYREETKRINGKLKDSTSLSKSLDAVPSCERAQELKKDHCEQLTTKLKKMKNKFCVLQKELSEAKEIKSQLENQKVKWEQELCSVSNQLNQLEERVSAIEDQMNEMKISYPAKLSFISEGEIKSFTDRQILRDFVTTRPALQETLKEALNMVSHPCENGNDLFHENCMLKKEIAMLKLEIDTLKHQHQEKENKYFEDLKILQEKNADLQMTLKLKEKTLTKRASQYSGQPKVLIAENAMLTSKLKEKQDKEIREREIESYHPRLASALQDHDQSATSRKKQELAFHSAGDTHLQGKMNVDVRNTIYNNEMLHQPLCEAQRKSKSLKINLNYAGDALRENTLVSEHAQRERDETQYQMKKAEHMYQNKQDNVDKHTKQQQSREQTLFQLQSKNMWLRQQLIHAHKKADNKSKITININFCEKKMQHHLLKEKNEEFNYGNHLKECTDQCEKEKAETEVS